MKTTVLSTLLGHSQLYSLILFTAVMLFTVHPPTAVHGGIGFPFSCEVAGCAFCGTQRMRQVCQQYCRQCSKVEQEATAFDTRPPVQPVRKSRGRQSQLSALSRRIIPINPKRGFFIARTSRRPPPPPTTAATTATKKPTTTTTTTTTTRPTTTTTTTTTRRTTTTTTFKPRPPRTPAIPNPVRLVAINPHTRSSVPFPAGPRQQNILLGSRVSGGLIASPKQSLNTPEIGPKTPIQAALVAGSKRGPKAIAPYPQLRTPKPKRKRKPKVTTTTTTRRPKTTPKSKQKTIPNYKWPSPPKSDDEEEDPDVGDYKDDYDLDEDLNDWDLDDEEDYNDDEEKPTEVRRERKTTKPTKRKKKNRKTTTKRQRKPKKKEKSKRRRRKDKRSKNRSRTTTKKKPSSRRSSRRKGGRGGVGSSSQNNPFVSPQWFYENGEWIQEAPYPSAPSAANAGLGQWDPSYAWVSPQQAADWEDYRDTFAATAAAARGGGRPKTIFEQFSQYSDPDYSEILEYPTTPLGTGSGRHLTSGKARRVGTHLVNDGDDEYSDAYSDDIEEDLNAGPVPLSQWPRRSLPASRQPPNGVSSRKKRKKVRECPNKEFKPCLKIASANKRFKKCCSQQGLPKSCYSICKYDVKRSQLETAFMWEKSCPINRIPKYLYCASGGNDAKSCCSSKGVLKGSKNVCRPFCDPASGIPAFNLGYLKCFDEMPTIMTCYHSTLKPKSQQLSSNSKKQQLTVAAKSGGRSGRRRSRSSRRRRSYRNRKRRLQSRHFADRTRRYSIGRSPVFQNRQK